MLVVDASVAVCWLAREADTDAAGRLLESGARLVAPSLLPMEVANVVWKKLRRGEFTHDQAVEGIARLDSLLPDIRSTTPLVAAALGLSIQMNHAIYDMIYLQMAIELDTRMVTLDASLCRKLAATPYARHILHLSDWNPP
jgi:predicted nucleic acid-binding protein